MKKFIALFLFSFPFLLQNVFLSPLAATSFHALLMADTEDENLKWDFSQDLQNVHASLSLITKACGVKFSPKQLTATDNALTKDAILDWIKHEPISEEDVVIFYYSGHGFRDRKSKTIWPCGEFDNGVRFSQMIEALFSKKAALYVVLLDCCNKTEAKYLTKSPEKKIIFDIDTFSKQKIEEGCKKLFLNSHGLIIASAASPGEIGYILDPLSMSYTVQIQISSKLGELPSNMVSNASDRVLGSVFTTIFLNNFFAECEEKHPRWKKIFKSTKNESYQKTKRRDYGPQTVQYKIFLHSKRQSPSTYKEYLFEDCKMKGKSCDVKEWEESDEELDIE